MADETRRVFGRAEVVVPVLYGGGVVAGAVGVIALVSSLGNSGLPLFLASVAAIAFAQMLEILLEIAGHLAAIRGQVGKGVLGLLG